jgi:hypothetical protein
MGRIIMQRLISGGRTLGPDREDRLAGEEAGPGVGYLR